MESIENNNYASKGAVTTANTLGGVALGLSVLNNGGLGGLLGGNRPAPEPMATQRDLCYERQLTEKDAKIGKLEAQQYTDQNLVAFERRVEDKFDRLEEQIAAQNQTQAVLNAHQSDAIAMVQGEINRYKAMFSLYINQPTMAASEAVLTKFSAPATTASTTQTAG